jgi:hypothetical protein
MRCVQGLDKNLAGTVWLAFGKAVKKHTMPEYTWYAGHNKTLLNFIQLSQKAE